jgi:hypothetical protein
MGISFWSVLIINYEDDYRHRYDNGAYPEQIKIFSTEDEAKKYICKRICDEIDEHIGSHEQEKYIVEYPKYFEKGEDYDECPCDYSIKKEYREDFKTVVEMHNLFCGGQFIPYIIDWEMDKHDKEVTDTKLKKGERKVKIYRLLRKFFKTYNVDKSDLDFHDDGLKVLKECYDIYCKKNIIV